MLLESAADDGGGDGDRAILCYLSLMLMMAVVLVALYCATRVCC